MLESGIVTEQLHDFFDFFYCDRLNWNVTAAEDALFMVVFTACVSDELCSTALIA